jgi:hypothetical protein
MPDGRKLKSGSDIEGIVRGAATLDLEDVRKAPAAAAGEPSVVTIAGDGGLTVTLRITKDGEDTWATVAATGEGETKGAAEDIARRTAGWEYKIGPGKAQAILKRRADLFEAS